MASPKKTAATVKGRGDHLEYLDPNLMPRKAMCSFFPGRVLAEEGVWRVTSTTGHITTSMESMETTQETLMRPSHCSEPGWETSRELRPITLTRQ